MKYSHLKIPIRIAATYLIIASFYILVSDQFFSLLFPTLEELAIAQTFKGLGFVLITSVILFFDLRHRIDEIEKEREKAEEAHTALEQSETTYRNMANYSPFAKFVNFGGKIVYLNQACMKLLGVSSPEEVIGRSSLEFFHSDYHGIILERVAALARVGESVPAVHEKIIRADGSVIDVETSASMFPYQKQNAIHVILRDITDEIAAREQIDRQLRQLRILHEIDQAILTNFDLRSVLAVCLQHVMTILGVDGANVVLMHAEEYGAAPFYGVGMANRVDEETGATAREQRLASIVRHREQVFIPDLGGPIEAPLPKLFELGAGFSAYCGVPLIAKGNVEGILELYSLSPLNPSDDWFEFLETLSSQIALAVEDLHYYAGMRQSLENLENAYDKTIEGWSKAMDLRDRETEGHTRRVTHLTLQLSEKFGFQQQDLQYIRWGAQLHDMGKLGIPDEILFKPGKLTEEEWVVMRLHPVFAYEMLQSIDYLKPALDIPYCHHEKWDGTGYPNGLQGEDIPLAARIFAVVDVWDALRSDRPYRASWPEARVMAYIQEQAGQQFDPAVVAAFMEYMAHDFQGRHAI